VEHGCIAVGVPWAGYCSKALDRLSLSFTWTCSFPELLPLRSADTSPPPPPPACPLPPLLPCVQRRTHACAPLAPMPGSMSGVRRAPEASREPPGLPLAAPLDAFCCRGPASATGSGAGACAVGVPQGGGRWAHSWTGREETARGAAAEEEWGEWGPWGCGMALGGGAPPTSPRPAPHHHHPPRAFPSSCPASPFSSPGPPARPLGVGRVPAPLLLSAQEGPRVALRPRPVCPALHGTSGPPRGALSPFLPPLGAQAPLEAPVPRPWHQLPPACPLLLSLPSGPRPGAARAAPPAARPRVATIGGQAPHLGAGLSLPGAPTPSLTFPAFPSPAAPSLVPPSRRLPPPSALVPPSLVLLSLVPLSLRAPVPLAPPRALGAPGLTSEEVGGAFGGGAGHVGGTSTRTPQHRAFQEHPRDEGHVAKSRDHGLLLQPPLTRRGQERSEELEQGSKGGVRLRKESKSTE